MDNTEIIEVKQAEMLQAINRAEIDMQVATAKQYPRDITQVLNKILIYATMDQETAQDCFYALKRKKNDQEDEVISGLSVRMAEIIAGCWGNLRVQARIIGNDGRMITAQAICHDLETNFAVSKEVKRSILTKQGRTYSQDMQVVTGNAASSIAFRNAVLTVIPKAVTKNIIAKVKQVAMGKPVDIETSRKNMLTYFANLGVSQEQLLYYSGVDRIEDIDKEVIFMLRATANAIKEGTTTAKETFIDPYNQAQAQKEAEKKADDANGKAAAAIAQATGQAQLPANVDPQTGEILTPETPAPKTTKKSTKK